jgi:formylglycine-generating enzyme required for sulfatase activity
MPVERQTVRFCHQLLQEYFAARQMRREDPAGLSTLWRLPWLESEMPVWHRPENNYDPLPSPPQTGWEETTILASVMRDGDPKPLLTSLLQINPILAGRCLLATSDPVEPGLRQAVIDKLLAAIGDAAVALRVRIAAGHILGSLGDPRTGEMINIPAGHFFMGEGREQHQASLPDYRIGKYPVTNAQYRSFIDAGGYNDKRWWTEAGWTEIGQKQKEPRFWQNARFNGPNQPAIGLSWYECVAFWHWLSAESGQFWRLPSEAEWEKAARGGDARLFPWGNEFDATRLNGRGPRNHQVCTTTPIGLYPSGISPFGLFDCVGNVWEWCATRWRKTYPYETTQDEWQGDYLQGMALRVLRGGSWYETKEATRCTHRFKFQPFGWNDRGGFRLVSSI